MAPRSSAKALTHDAVIAELRTIAKRLDVSSVAGAFMASLGVAPGFWRAPLIALAAARAVPKHAIGGTFSGGDCRECGLEKAPVLRAIHERGQCLPGDLAGALAVLRELVTRGQPPAPSAVDVRNFVRLLALVGELPPGAREGKLNQAISREKLVRGNNYDRRHVIETLGACGILETPEHPGFTTQWTTFASRQARPSSNVECDPPIAFYTAGHGVNAKNVAFWFGAFGVEAPKSAAPRKGPAPPKPAAKKRAVREPGLAKGDVVGILVNKTWIAAVVTNLFRDAKGVDPVVELLDFRSAKRPTAAIVHGKRARGTKWGKAMIRAPYILSGLRADGATPEAPFVVCKKAPAPSASHLAPPLGLGAVAHFKEIADIARDAGLVR